MEAATPPPPVPAESPKSPMVIGILNLIFGGIGLLSSLFAYKLYFTPLETQTGVMADLMRSSTFYATSMRILSVPAVLFCLLQFVSGLGLLKAREWARKTAIACAVYGLLVGIFLGYLNVVHVMPFTTEYALRTTPQIADPQFAKMMHAIMKASGLVGSVAGLIYPVLIIIFLTRPKVRVHCIAASSKPANLIA